ncbi:cytochrome C [Sulfurimonas aquatica]|uniref:Cytochrome C n=1 Tax=Sulfurimonas aquatica TaxID=2672570 RepID=A0A975GDZ0_9BACT|nr:cytochrome C [Sulfurimonas aquatica]QSZ42878.1 cytochrome C [Sulfurimonas aquatica]
MKKAVIGLVIFSGLLFGASYTKEDRIRDMNGMANAMNVIQSGFFYNNYETVAAGVDDLTTVVAKMRPPTEELNEKDIMAKFMNQKVQMSNKIVKKINKKALTILQRFKSGDTTQAVQAYTKIMGQCVKCHNEMRNW